MQSLIKSEKKSTSYEPLTTFEYCSAAEHNASPESILNLFSSSDFDRETNQTFDQTLHLARAKTMRTVQTSEGKTKGRYGRITQLGLNKTKKCHPT